MIPYWYCLENTGAVKAGLPLIYQNGSRSTPMDSFDRVLLGPGLHSFCCLLGSGAELLVPWRVRPANGSPFSFVC